MGGVEMENGLLLAIDTATEQSGIALYDGECLDEVAWTTCRNQTVNMLSQIDLLLRRADCEIGRVGAVAVTTGPGRFTSLRVGLSIAKGLYVAQEVAVLGVPTLDAVALPYRSSFWSVVAVVNAGRNRFAWSLYTGPGTDPQHPDVHHGDGIALTAAVSAVPGLVLVTGELGADVIERVQGFDQVTVAPQAGRLGRAGAAAEIGWRRWLAGDLDDPISLSPSYVHTLAGAGSE